MNEPCDKMFSFVCQKNQNWLFSQLKNTVMVVRDNMENLTKHLDNTNKLLENTKSELDFYKSELKHVLNNASTGCSLSEDWIKCEYFIDFRTNKRQVIAIPKSINDKFVSRDNTLNICKRYNSTLVSIESEEKQLFLEQFIQSHTQQFWTSGYNGEDKKWRWINGKELTYSNWNPGEPSSGYPSEPCLEFNRGHPGKWNDVNCSIGNLGLCEFDVV